MYQRSHLRILLVEDAHDAPELQRSLESLGECEFVVAENLNRAAFELQSKGHPFDWVVINPEAGNITISRGMFDDAVDRLRAIAGDAKIFVLERKSSDPAMKRAVRQFADSRDDVRVVGRSDRATFATEYEELIKRRSGGSTTQRVELARLEGKVARLEENIREMKADLIEIRKLLQSFGSTISELSIKLSYAIEDQKEEKGEVAQFQDRVEDLETVVSSLAAKDSEGTEKSDRDAKILLGVISAIVTLAIAFGAPIINHYFPPRTQQHEPKPENPEKIEGKK